MGRGIEGCGVTKYTLELAKWINTTNRKARIFSSADKKWSRENAHEDAKNIQTFKLKDDASTTQLIHNLNECDYVICTSLPSKGHPKKMIDNFERTLSEITVPFVLLQLDHKAQSIRRNECMESAINKADLLFALSTTNPFSNVARQQLGEGALNEFFGDETTDIFDYQVCLDMSDIKNKYWKPIEETDAKHHKWIGRTTYWKGYNKMFEFHDNYLRANNCLTTIEGIERSPAYLTFKELGEFGEHKVGIEEYDLSNDYGNCLQTFGPYIHSEMLERMSKVGFGYQLSLLQEEYINRAVEYTHLEIVSVGAIPVFRELYGNHCHDRVSGKPLTQCKDTGTIWLSEDIKDMDKAFQLISKLENDSVMRDEWRTMAYEFYYNHQDSHISAAEVINNIEEKING
jgi:hypothetical protein